MVIPGVRGFGRSTCFVPLLLAACSGSVGSICGPGTHDENGICLPDSAGDAAVQQPGADAAVEQPGADAAAVTPGADAAVVTPGADASVVSPGADAAVIPPGPDAGACGTANSCGGCGALAHQPGAACGTCGTYQCSGTEAVACGGEHAQNACGGCSALPHAPGDSCGSGGSYDCDGTDAVQCSGSTLSPPSQAAGYHLVFDEEFDTFDVSPDKYGDYKWYPAIPVWDLCTPPAGNISVANSELTLTWSRTQGCYVTAVSTCALDASKYRAWRYGYVEIRMRWDVTIGAWPSLWMMSVQQVQGATATGEIDIFEGQGGESDWFYGTIHDWKSDGSIEPRNNHVLAPAGTDYSQYHTYGFLWTPSGEMHWYLDDQEMGTGVQAFPIFATQDYYLILNMIEGANWTYGSVDGVTANDIAMSVDWVRIWQQ